ncbi:MAG: enhanced serine sensitivity protein SseB C-terminal domain-containing protein [Chloroflexi bacterium]|nr:enhanced serine sensitivity protein SseB C-terminal domain-containing protein [Chloroflexota bacterium]
MDLFLEPLAQEPSDPVVNRLKQELARHPEVLAGFLFDVSTESGDTHLTLGIRLAPLVDTQEQTQLTAEITNRLNSLPFADEQISVVHLDDEALRRILAVATPIFYRDIQTLEEQDAILAGEFHFNRGNECDDKDNRAQAIKEWEKAIELDPNHGGAHYNLGLAYADEDKLEFAIYELRQAQTLDPFDTDAAHDLADLLLQEERVDEAIKVLHQSLSLNPRDRESALELATVYIDNDMLDEAFGALDQAAGAMDFETSMDEDAGLWFELGQAYSNQDRIDDAILAYRRAVAANGHPEAIAALENLNVPIEEPPDPAEES